MNRLTNKLFFSLHNTSKYFNKEALLILFAWWAVILLCTSDLIFPSVMTISAIAMIFVAMTIIDFIDYYKIIKSYRNSTDMSNNRDLNVKYGIFVPKNSIQEYIMIKNYN